MWVTLQLVLESCCIYIFLWPTVCEWHCTFCERQSHHIFPMTNRLWVTLHICQWKAVSSHLLQWPTASESHCTFCERQSHHIFYDDQQAVSDIHTFCERQSHHIFPCDQQEVSDIALFVKGSLITSFPVTNRKWVTLHILWKAASSHLFLWPTASEWHCRFCERQSHHTCSYDQQQVSMTLHILWLEKAVSSHFFLWTTGSEWPCTFCERQSHHIFSNNQQRVSDTAHFVKGNIITSFSMTNSEWVTLHILWKAVSSHLCLWPTGSEWHCTFCERQSHHILFYDQQRVSDTAKFVKGSLITSFPMTNSKWVTFHILWKAVPSHLFLWPTGSVWYCTFCERQSDHIFSYDQQEVSDIEHFVRGSLITSFPMTDRKWVTLHFLWKAVSSHLFLWPTACEWHCTFCERQSHHIFSYGQQQVSDIALFVQGSLFTSFPMTNREWVTLHILFKSVSSHLFLWPIGSEWYCTLCERQSHHIFSYDQKEVSANVAHFVKGTLITSFPMTNRMWVTLHILWKEVSSHLFSYDQQEVSNIAHFVKGRLITSFPMTNSLWVTLHILWKAGQSHHTLSYGQQLVSDIAHFVKGSLITSSPMTNRKWVTLHILWKAVSSHLSYDQQQVKDIAHFVKGSLITSFPMINSKWVILHILWMAVSSHCFLWPTASEWHWIFCERQYHHIFSYDEQQVSDIAHFVKGSLITSFPMTNRKWVKLHILWKAVSSYLFLWPKACEWHFVQCSLATSFPMTNRQ